MLFRSKQTEIDRAPALAQLGPDLLTADLVVDVAVDRLRARGDMDIADALLDQQAIAGIGNIWKSESLFAARINPFDKVRDLSSQQLHVIVEKARALMLADRAAPFRVYGRAGKPCARCRTPISRQKQGPNARSTYWCAQCQVTSASRPDRDPGSDPRA